MKVQRILVLIFLLTGFRVVSQDLPETNDKATTISKSTTTPVSEQPVFIIESAKKRYLIQDNSDEPLKKINSDQIKSIDVYKGESAISLLGNLGKNGVVVIFLKKKQKVKFPRRYKAPKDLPKIIDIE